MQKCTNQGVGVFNSPERSTLMQDLPKSLSLSLPESRGDMPFSFPTPGVITASGSGSVGHLGLLHAKRRKINVSTKVNSTVVMSGGTSSCPRESPGP